MTCRWTLMRMPSTQNVREYSFSVCHGPLPNITSVITVDAGLFKIEENDCYMYKVQDVKLTATLLERMFGLGTVICYTGDVTTPELRLIHIKHSREVKNYILKASEIARMKRRTLNTLDIGAGADIDDLDS